MKEDNGMKKEEINTSNKIKELSELNSYDEEIDLEEKAEIEEEIEDEELSEEELYEEDYKPENKQKADIEIGNEDERWYLGYPYDFEIDDAYKHLSAQKNIFFEDKSYTSLNDLYNKNNDNVSLSFEEFEGKLKNIYKELIISVYKEYKLTKFIAKNLFPLAVKKALSSKVCVDEGIFYEGKVYSNLDEIYEDYKHRTDEFSTITLRVFKNRFPLNESLLSQKTINYCLTTPTGVYKGKNIDSNFLRNALTQEEICFSDHTLNIERRHLVELGTNRVKISEQEQNIRDFHYEKIRMEEGNKYLEVGVNEIAKTERDIKSLAERIITKQDDQSYINNLLKSTILSRTDLAKRLHYQTIRANVLKAIVEKIDIDDLVKIVTENDENFDFNEFIEVNSGVDEFEYVAEYKTMSLVDNFMFYKDMDDKEKELLAYFLENVDEYLYAKYEVKNLIRPEDLSPEILKAITNLTDGLNNSYTDLEVLLNSLLQLSDETIKDFEGAYESINKYIIEEIMNTSRVKAQTKKLIVDYQKLENSKKERESFSRNFKAKMEKILRDIKK
jgi:hypothetical protein